MSEQAPQSHDTVQTPAASAEKRHNPNFATVVVGGRHEEPDATFRKGELYTEGGLQMSRFLRLSESGTSTGMLVVTKDKEGKQQRFYIMRGAPKGVMAQPQQVSLTNVDKSVKDSDFSTKVYNPERVAAISVSVGQEFAPGAGIVERIVVDTGERVPRSEIDTNASGASLFTQELRDAQSAMKIVEQQVPQPF